MKAALEEDSLDKVILMPAKVSPFKIGRKMASEKDRINMLKAACAPYENVEISTIEMDSTEVSYTYKTLTEFQKNHPHDRLWFILGSDSLLSLEDWYKGRELLSAFSFVLAPRPGYDLYETDEKIRIFMDRYHTEFKILHNQLFDVSSTEIKTRLKEGKSIRELVPEGVEQYIYEHGLYQ